MYQEKLPQLPIPPLNSTKEKLIEWVKPLLNKEQLKQTKIVMNDFFRKNGEAEKLQAKLQKWKKSGEGNWLAPLWDDLYLNHRDGLPYTSNFNVLLKADQTSKAYSIPKIVSKISCLVTEYYHKIIDQEIDPALVRGEPLDMSQFKSFFRSMRTPHLERDDFHIADFDKSNNFIILLYKNNFYKVPVTNDRGEIYQVFDIVAAVTTIIQLGTKASSHIGLMTTAKRDQAAIVYQKLNSSKINAQSLQKISDSLLIISIDEASETAEEAIKQLMLGATNKYFDKTIQIIVTKYGAIGFNVEHSAIDGTSIAALISYVSEGLKQPLPQKDQPLKEIAIQKLPWKLTEKLEVKLSKLKTQHVQRKKEYFLQPNTFTDFGAEQIKQLNLSPDAFFHMALQLAQYRTFGSFKSVYEPVSVRSFYKGRTECSRATSIEKCILVKAITGKQSSNKELYNLMQHASNAHVKRIRDCQRGIGIERHLYGLEQMYYLYGDKLGLETLPAVFKDHGYKTLFHDFISTSGIAYKDVKYRMFAPTVDNGYGVAYFLLADKISFNVSSFAEDKLKNMELKKNMFEALKELKLIAKSTIEIFS